jgi:hypothetical protein
MARRPSARTIAKHLKALGLEAPQGGNVGDVLKSIGRSAATGDMYRETEHERLDRIRNELEMARQRVSLEAESVLYYVKVRGVGFSDKTCEECKQPFATTYGAVDYCSDLCRYKSLAKIGIAWNIYGKTDSERWDGRIPKVIGPAAFKAALEAVERELDEEEAEEAANPSVDPMIDREEEEMDLMVQEILAETDTELEGDT